MVYDRSTRRSNSSAANLYQVASPILSKWLPEKSSRHYLGNGVEAIPSMALEPTFNGIKMDSNCQHLAQILAQNAYRCTARAHICKGCTFFGACELRCWLWFYGNKIPTSLYWKGGKGRTGFVICALLTPAFPNQATSPKSKPQALRLQLLEPTR